MTLILLSIGLSATALAVFRARYSVLSLYGVSRSGLERLERLASNYGETAHGG